MIYIVIIAIFIIVTVLTFAVLKEIDKQNDEKEESDYEVYKTKTLTQAQIADIHERGKITPEEKVKELEGLGMCIGDHIESMAWRCDKFRNCHDCLVDYANTKDEYTSFFDDIKIICK